MGPLPPLGLRMALGIEHLISEVFNNVEAVLVQLVLVVHVVHYWARNLGPVAREALVGPACIMPAGNVELVRFLVVEIDAPGPLSVVILGALEERVRIVVIFRFDVLGLQLGLVGEPFVGVVKVEVVVMGVG